MKIKYTRYDLKRRRKNKAISSIILVLTVLCLIFLGVIYVRYISNQNLDADKENVIEKVWENKDKGVGEDKGKEITFVKGEVVKYAAVQGGLFKNEEYATETRNKLLPFGNAFMITEGEFKRVILGVYEEEESKKVMEALTKENIECSRMVFQIVYDDICDFQRAQIVNAYLQILSKLSEKNVKSIQTKELKAWVSTLSEVDPKNKNIERLNEIKTKIQSLPEHIAKENLEENYKFIYEHLKK